SLRHTLLVLLAERPHTGYELTQRMQRTVALFWSARHSQIYPELGAMRVDDLVEYEASSGPGPRDKKTYDITDRGRAVLRDWLGTPSRPRPPKDELVLAAFGAASADLGALADRFRAEAQRIEARLTEFAAIRDDFDGRPETDDPARPEFGWSLSLLNGELNGRARLDWCRQVVERLDQAAAR
ncbi:MAG: hypothetical protein GEU96_22360, partial [Propionibacteriales bacterium]|nr:hypothetical protein [Propionibacteriales bacterium]